MEGKTFCFLKKFIANECSWNVETI